MKKILIIEDDQIVGNVYRNKLALEGYTTEVALDGETGLEILLTFRPDLIILDLMLPGMNGVDVIKVIRSEEASAKVPIIVFSNTYLTNLIQEAWRAGANKCLSKSNCTPKDVIEMVRNAIGGGSTITPAKPATEAVPAKPAAKPVEKDAEYQADLRKSFIENLAATLNSLRAGVLALVKAENDTARLKQVYELYRQVHTLNSNAGLAGLVQIAHMASAFEALLKELYEKPKNINASSTRTIAAAVDFLGFLFEKGTVPDRQEIPNSKILVVDDEAISRRAIVYALEKAKLKSVNVEDPKEALQLLTDNEYDLIFLDVDMPDMNGFELCAKLRALPQHRKTPVVFVTSLNDFDSRTSSTMAGGNDFIGKPFLFIELTVKSLIHLLRSKYQNNWLKSESAVKKWKLVSLGALGVFAALQLFNPARTNPPVKVDFIAATSAPANIAAPLRSACYDCHSHETKWPWYAHVAPVCWLVVSDTMEGREHLNFSDWPAEAASAAKKLDRINEVLDYREMPPKKYTLIHADARLTEAQRKEIMDWTEAAAAKLRAATNN